MAAKKKSTAKRTPSSGSDPKSKRIVQSKVGDAMHEFKQGELNTGNSTKKVKSPKQAIAIGLSEARRAGAKIPPAPAKKAAAPTKKRTPVIAKKKAASPAKKTAAAKRTARTRSR